MRTRIRPFRDHVGGNAVVRQEASHIRIHRLYNVRLASQHVPVDALEALLEKRQRNPARQALPVMRPALTACLEHYTTILSHRLLSDSGDPRRRRADDGCRVALARDRGNRAQVRRVRRVRGTDAGRVAALRRALRSDAPLSVYFVIDLIYFVHRLVAVDSQTRNVPGWLQLLRWLLRFSPRFRPDRVDCDAALRSARAALEPYLATAEREPESHA